MSNSFPPPSFIGFDIETRPLLDNVARFTKLFPDFDSLSVKLGNVKDSALRAEKIEAARLAHHADCAAYWQNARDRAALDPMTGAVVCIGIVTEEGEPAILAGDTEADTLRQWWRIVADSDQALSKFVFWSGCGDAAKKFDLDFLVTRSRLNRVPLPHRVRDGRFYHSRFVDLASEFLLYQRERYLSLTKAAEMFGLYAEHEDLTRKRDDDALTGEHFWRWWDGVAPVEMPAEAQRAEAVKYLNNDVRHLLHLAPLLLP
jgi:hypothetical protein